MVADLLVIKGALVKFARICSWPVSKVLRVKRAMQIKICLIAYHKVVRQVWIFSQYSVKLTTKSQMYLFVAQRMHSLQFVWEKIYIHMREQPYTSVIHVYACAGCGLYHQHWAIPSSVGNEDGRPSGCVQVTGSSWWFSSRRNPRRVSGSCLNKQFHRVHIPQLRNAPCRLTVKVTALARTPVRDDTLAAKRVTEILKFFTFLLYLCNANADFLQLRPHITQKPCVITKN